MYNYEQVTLVYFVRLVDDKAMSSIIHTINCTSFNESWRWDDFRLNSLESVHREELTHRASSVIQIARIVTAVFNQVQFIFSPIIDLRSSALVYVIDFLLKYNHCEETRGTEKRTDSNWQATPSRYGTSIQVVHLT